MHAFFHGDVLFIKDEESDPKGITVDRRVAGFKADTDYIVAEGEVTGHCHRVHTDAGLDDVRFVAPKHGEEISFMVVKDTKKAHTITHEEHRPEVLLPGKWTVGRQRTYDLVERLNRAVAD